MGFQEQHPGDGSDPRTASADARTAADAAGPAAAPNVSARDAGARHAGVPGVSGPAPARMFVGRLAQLDLAAVRAVVADWHQTMREEARAWLAAEEALAQAVVASGRRDAQRPLLLYVAQAFARAVWYGPEARAGGVAPETRVGASEASGQYIATVATLALLARDHLEPAAFEILYRPFVPFIPPAELGRE